MNATVGPDEEQSDRNQPEGGQYGPGPPLPEELAQPDAGERPAVEDGGRRQPPRREIGDVHGGQRQAAGGFDHEAEPAGDGSPGFAQRADYDRGDGLEG